MNDVPASTGRPNPVSALASHSIEVRVGEVCTAAITPLAWLASARARSKSRWAHRTCVSGTEWVWEPWVHMHSIHQGRARARSRPRRAKPRRANPRRANGRIRGRTRC